MRREKFSAYSLSVRSVDASEFCETTVPGSIDFSWGNVISAVGMLWSKLSPDYNNWMGEISIN